MSLSKVDRRRAFATVAVTVLWIALIALIALGLASVAFRLLFPGDSALRLVPSRGRFLAMLGRPSDSSATRLAELAQFDRRYEAHSLATLAHILPGAIFVVLVPLQLARPIRTRFPSFHRWTGRALISLAVITATSALIFGLGMPFGGLGEAIAVALVATWFFTSLFRAYVAVRRGDVATHREWMLRAVAGAIGVSVVRVFGTLVDLTLTPLGLSAANVFVIALWLGFATTIAVSEWWIHHTRPQFE